MLRVHLGDRSYEIALSQGDFGPLLSWIEPLCPSLALLVADTHTAIHAQTIADVLGRGGVKVATMILPAGEAQKTLASADSIYERLIELRADRHTIIVAVGGGVIGDLAGFVAATFMRGLPLLMVPTSLLAMVDSSVGGKVAVNHARGKNLIGAFHQPIGVWIEPAFLDTLPAREFNSGLAEVVKYGMILDAELFRYLEARAEDILSRQLDPLVHIIRRSCALKAEVVEKDERDSLGQRVLLNFGHTFGHALETATFYGALLHGEAVALGMLCACRLAGRRGLMEPALTGRLEQLLQRLQLPTTLPDVAIDQVIALMKGDKKSVSGRVHVLLPTSLGQVRLFQDASEEELRAALRDRPNA